MRRALSGFGFAVMLAAALPASAQVGTDVADQAKPPQKPQPPPARKGPPREPLGFRAYVNFDVVSMTASDSFKAVLGTSKMSGIGGGGEILKLWKQLFARVDVSSMSDNGTRVAIVNGQVIDLGVPIKVKIRTVEIGGGLRYVYRPRPRTPTPPKPPGPAKPAPAPPPRAQPAPPARPAAVAQPRFTFYGGAGILRLAYNETSDFAALGDDDRASLGGYSAFGGVDIWIWKWVTAGVEAQYRKVANALGEAGVSKEYGEKDLGGAAVRVMIGVRR